MTAFGIRLAITTQAKQERHHNRYDLPKKLDFLALWRHLHLLSRCTKASDQTEATPLRMGLPTEPLDWTNWIEISEREFIGGGGFGDVFKGRWRNLPPDIGPMPELVVKVIKVGPIGTKMAEKRYKLIQREVCIWNAVHHENIVPFVGVCYARGPECPILISPFMENRDIMFYLQENPQVERQSMLVGIALGLEFLHNFEPEIIHGDVKGANILVDRRGQPCLIDFGISRMVSNQTLWRTSSTHAPGSIRWQAPELMTGTQSTVTAKGDVYAFAMTCLEVMTGSAPFREHANDIVVLNAVSNSQKIPERPMEINGKTHLWTLWNKCWVREVEARPPMTHIVRELRIIDFLGDLLISSMSDIHIFAILFLLRAGNCESALEMLLFSTTATCSEELRAIWNEQLPRNLAHLVLDHCQPSSLARSALIDAAERGAEDEVRNVLDSLSPGLDKDQVMGDLKSALIHASHHGHRGVVPLLLLHAVGIKAMASALESNLRHGIQQGHWKVIEVLLPYETNAFKNSELCINGMLDNSQNGQIDVVRTLIKGGIDVTAKDSAGSTSLQCASVSGHVELVKLLLMHDADIEAKNVDGLTALHCAAAKGHVEVTRLLLERVTDIEVKDIYGWTALHSAAESGNAEVARLLLEHGADIEAKTTNFMTALHRAAIKGHKEVVSLLLEYNADVRMKSYDGRTALHLAASLNRLEVVSLLLQHGADISAENNHGSTALHEAAYNRCPKVVKLLVEHGADASIKGRPRRRGQQPGY